MSTKNIPTGRALRFMLSYMRRHFPSIVSGILLLMTVDTCQLVIPRIVKKVLDTLGEQEFSSTLVVKSALSITALAVAMTVLRFCYRLFLFLPSRKIEMKMRIDLFEHLIHLPASFFNVTKTGDIMALFINDLNAVRMATGMALIATTDALFMGTMSLVFMLTIDVKLTLVAVAPLPVIALFMIRFGGVIQSKFTAVQESFGTISSRAQEAFSGIRAVKGFVQERAEVRAFSAHCDEYVDNNIRLVKVWGILFPLVSFFGSLSIGLLFLYGGKQVIGGSLSLGSFVSFTFYIQLFLWPIMAFGWVYNLLQRGIASAKRLLGLRETAPETVIPVRHEGPAAPVKGHIVIRNLSFRFAGADRDVLRGIDLDIPAGGSLGIIGKPGAGKTTLVSLLFHLFPVERGSLFIDGIDINDLPLPYIRKSIGYVPQDSFLFSDTIENNIAFGLDERTLDESSLRRAGRTAAIDRDISLFPAGYATVIGERGITLSGGQKQRLSIARAIILKPPILILDDALSSIDAGTEREVLAAVKEELRERTSLVIAHRISTVRGCDSIIVIDHGTVSERGTHDELVAGGGFYARLHALQSLHAGRGNK
ncbi:MAG: ABC transporter ATP-binding protein [Chitinispirillaceae bacterium]|nr:ABC transporter ATP-binding protein [Chitinispirillaceae bacterium]